MEEAQGQDSGPTHLTAQEVGGCLGLWYPLCQGSLQDPSFLVCHHPDLDLAVGTFWADTHSAKVTETARRPTASGGKAAAA